MRTSTGLAGVMLAAVSGLALASCQGPRTIGMTPDATGSQRAAAQVAPIATEQAVIAPLSVLPMPYQAHEQYAPYETGGFIMAADQQHSTFAADVDTAAYTRIRRYIADGMLPPAELVRIEEMVNYFDYDYPVPADRYHPLAIATELAPAPWNERSQLLRVGIQGFHEDSVLRPPLNLVFLVDVSGSMQPPDRLPLLQQGLAELVGTLRPVDRVAIVAYAGGVGTVLQPTTGERQAEIREAVLALSAGGSTNGAGGLEAAYDLAAANYDPKAVNRVILVTDGDFNVGTTGPGAVGDMVADRRDLGIYMTVLGVGTDNLNDAMMQQIAQRGDGIAAYVDGPEEMRRALGASTAHTLFPIADDVKIQVSFNPALVAEYRLIGYETRAISREEFLDDAADGGDVSAGHSVTALYEIVPGLSIASAEPARVVPAAYLPDVAWDGDTVAQVELRYQHPRSDTVERIVASVAGGDLRARLDRASDDTRFAAAVAGFGLLLRDDPAMLRGFNFAAVAALAESALGDDPTGERAEFVRLVRAAADIPR